MSRRGHKPGNKGIQNMNMYQPSTTLITIPSTSTEQISRHLSLYHDQVLHITHCNNLHRFPVSYQTLYLIYSFSPDQFLIVSLFQPVSCSGKGVCMPSNIAGPSEAAGL